VSSVVPTTEQSDAGDAPPTDKAAAEEDDDDDDDDDEDVSKYKLDDSDEEVGTAVPLEG